MKKHWAIRHKRKIISSIAIIILLQMATSCLDFRMSDKKVLEYFKEKGRPEPTIGRYKVGDRTVRYVSAGNDTLPPIIFVHGAPGGLDAFIQYMASDLSDKAHLISVDRPGYGYSDFGRSETSIQKQAELLSPLFSLNKSQQKAIMVGHSYGGPIVSKMAMLYPDSIRSLVLAAPAIDPEHEVVFWISYPADLWLFRWAVPTSLRVSNDEKLSHVEELKLMADDWKLINKPVIFIHGESDGLVPFPNALFGQKKLVNAQLKMVTEKDMGHLFPFENPQYIFDAINELLQKP